MVGKGGTAAAIVVVGVWSRVRMRPRVGRGRMVLEGPPSSGTTTATAVSTTATSAGVVACGAIPVVPSRRSSRVGGGRPRSDHGSGRGLAAATAFSSAAASRFALAFPSRRRRRRGRGRRGLWPWRVTLLGAVVVAAATTAVDISSTSPGIALVGAMVINCRR